MLGFSLCHFGFYFFRGESIDVIYVKFNQVSPVVAVKPASRLVSVHHRPGRRVNQQFDGAIIFKHLAVMGILLPVRVGDRFKPSRFGQGFADGFAKRCQVVCGQVTVGPGLYGSYRCQQSGPLGYKDGRGMREKRLVSF